jgi:hypothetical protein
MKVDSLFSELKRRNVCNIAVATRQIESGLL